MAQDVSEPDEQEARQGTIVVTGQKIDRSLQDTAVSVAVVTDLQLQQENIIDLVDAIERTANITTRDGSRFTIRGIDSLNVSGAGQGDLATIYVDGVALPRQASFAAPVDIWDISQIELFRGPQSTLQGRASLAGAIIINTADPSYETSGRLRAIYTTEEDSYRIGGAIGGPIIADQMAYRLAFERSESDGFGTNLTTGEPLDPVDTLTGRAKLLIEPEAVPGLEVLLSYTHDQRTSGEVFNSLAVDDPEDERVGFSNDPIIYDTEINMASATVDYEINDQWSLTSITGWNNVDYSFVFDDDRSAEPFSARRFKNIVETWTQEVRFQYSGETIDAVFGGFYSNVDTPTSDSTGTLPIDLVNDLGLDLLLQLQFGLDAATSAFVVSQYPNPALITTDQEFSQEIETYAAFSDLSWKFADRWTLYAGFRYDVEQQSNVNAQTVTVASALPDPALYPVPLNQVIAGVNAFFVAQATNATSPATAFDSPEFGGFLPKIGIGYDISDDQSISLIAQRGYRSGGAAINTAQSRAFEFDQEFIWNYELGYRSQWFDRALTLNANLFYIDWTDQQVRVQLSNNVFDIETQNAGASSVTGFEIESQYAPNDQVDIYGSIGYAKTDFEEFDVVVGSTNAGNFSQCTPFQGSFLCDFSGNEFAFAPEWTLNAGVNWRPTDNWIANVNANHTSASFLRADRP
ncbi:MAG: TonB-dependent receptor, partial [Pseudomonadota bacterium]